MSVNTQAKEAPLLDKPAAVSDESDIIEQILEELGGMGTYQKYLFFMLMPFMLIFSFVYGVQIFITATPQEHWCRVPDLMHLDVHLRRNLSTPGASSGLNWDRCLMFDANWTQVLANMTPPASNTPTVPCKDGWEFLYDDIPYTTVVSEREWVCEKSSYAPTAQVLFYVGSLIGSCFFGWMGDRLGRLSALIASNFVGCVGGIATIFTSGFWDFVVCRFLVGLSYDTGFMMIYILVLEYVGPKHRSMVANLSMGLFFGTGGMLLPALAYWLMSWKLLLFWTSAPMLIVVAVPWIIPESARWLASKGKTNKAIEVLNRFERINKAKISEELLEKFIKTSSQKVVTDESITALIRSAPIRNSLLYVMFVLAIAMIVLDAVIRLSESIGPNLFVTYGVSSLSEIPALALVAVILDWLGRRCVSFLTIGAAGVLCLVCTVVPQGLPQMVLAVLTRFSVNMSFGALYQLGIEILPTGLRGLGTSILHSSMFITVTAAPYIVYSGRIWRELPLIILGVMSLIGAGTSLLLPETMGQPMPQTIADGEKMIRQGILCRKPEKDDLEYREVETLDNKNALESI